MFMFVCVVMTWGLKVYVFLLFKLYSHQGSQAQICGHRHPFAQNAWHKHRACKHIPETPVSIQSKQAGKEHVEVYKYVKLDRKYRCELLLWTEANFFCNYYFKTIINVLK